MKFYAIDLFCGIGGLSKGLELANIPVIAGIDIDNTCRFAYEKNTKSVFILQNIENLESCEIAKLYPIDTDIKILVGCAPCQPFSKYSQRYRKDGFEDNKWKLLYEFLRLIRDIKPEIVSIENVPDLSKQSVFLDFVSTLEKLGYSVDWKIVYCPAYGVPQNRKRLVLENVPDLSKQSVFLDFVSTLEKLGYSVDWKIVYCPAYGVPQNRKRLVLLASLIAEIQLIKPVVSEKNYPTVRDAIGKLKPIKAGEQDKEDPLHRASRLSELNLKRIESSSPGGTWRDWDPSIQLNCHKKNTGSTYPSVYGRMEWDEPSPTITTQFYGYGNGRFGHPEQNRALSIREGALLQSFPEDYVFIDQDHPSNNKELGIHIGNAVPVELGKAIGITIYNHIKENLKDGKEEKDV